MAENWLSLRAYARHRGVGLGAVQKAIESGRVTAVRRGVDGRLNGIEQVQADLQWAARTDPVEAARSGTVLQPPSGELPLGDPLAAGKASAPGNSDDFYESRARQAHYAAENAEMEFKKSSGELVFVADQSRVSARRYRALRDKLQGIPDRTCDVLAAERDAAAIHALLTKEITQALNELADTALAEAEASGDERLAA